MLALSDRNTMRNARPKFREPEPEPRNLVTLRNEGRLERLREARQADLAVRVEKVRTSDERQDRITLNGLLPKARKVVERIARATKVRPSVILGHNRIPQACFARQAVIYWLSRLTNWSSVEIGKRMGGFDHSTILHGKKAYVSKRKAMGRTLRRAR